MSRSILAATLISAATLAAPAYSATLDISEDGILMGAFDVAVGGTLYDVEFLNGSCVSLFTECDGQDDFAFNDASTALLAAQALLDQVLLDVSLSNQFDSKPGKTNGCVIGLLCTIFVGYDFDAVLPNLLLAHGVVNNLSIVPDAIIGPTGISISTPILETDNQAFARFTQTGTVPLPATSLLMLGGLAGFGALRRKGSTA